LALVQMSLMEQRYRAVLAVRAGDRVNEVAARIGCPGRPCIADWPAMTRTGWSGWRDRSHRPESCPHQASPEASAVGGRRIVFELGRHGCPGPVPSRMTVYRILARHGLHVAVKRERGPPGPSRRPRRPGGLALVVTVAA
jgi:hypothetical protein